MKKTRTHAGANGLFMLATQLEMLMIADDPASAAAPLRSRSLNALMMKNGAMVFTLNTSTQLSIVSGPKGSSPAMNAVIFLLPNSGSEEEYVWPALQSMRQSFHWQDNRCTTQLVDEDVEFPIGLFNLFGAGKNAGFVDDVHMHAVYLVSLLLIFDMNLMID